SSVGSPARSTYFQLLLRFGVSRTFAVVKCTVGSKGKEHESRFRRRAKVLPPTEELLEMHRQMVLSREFEETLCEIHAKSPIPELPHASTGQEAVGVGVCFRLRPDDVIIPSVRSHPAFLAKGVPTRTLMAGAFGKATSPSGGRNTSHHMGDMSRGIIAGSAVLTSHLPIAVGVALASKMEGKDYVSVAFFGDGSSNRGEFHESLNLAAILKLPVIFVCENNLHALSIPASYHMSVPNVADRAVAYNIPGVIVDGNDVLAVVDATSEAVARARRGDGPTLMECKTYRWRGHSERDPTDPRPKEEIALWKARCPIARSRRLLIEEVGVEESRVLEVEASAKAEVADAASFAQESPYPVPEDCLTGVYAPAEGE
ncbi:MAG TPA: thiamine pyrophosphate-dependent dehydrogenase E1 component subunit alpha, partial [Chloroflexota bacterium]|nr:thiamine pyrophosphate-dependent dehydrogenase E1 component subunit alpha [Chloroflexota bacterium]